ncbi:Fibronectin type III [Candidatus Nanopelagicaceae bacterium]
MEAPSSKAVTSIEFESLSPALVVLGSLASRSQNKQLTKSGAAVPYTMTGRDGITNLTYQYQTDQNYSTAATLRESDERPGSTCVAGSGIGSYSGTTTGTDTGKTGVIQLTSSGQVCRYPTGSSVQNQTTSGNASYGSMFGPQIWSKPFVGASGQAVSYQWKAAMGADDYEVYGFLVKIDAQSGCTTSTDYGLVNPTTTHSILTYSRGKNASWTSASGSISDNGCYRFRFVGGTFDQTGGFALGATFYIYGVTLGDAQTLTFAQPADLIASSSNQTVNLSVTSNAPGATITYASTTTGVCTVNSSGVVTVLANQTGNCSINADSAAISTYGAATTVSRTFVVRAAATAPISSGGDLVSGTQSVCSTLTAQLGTWGTGGADYIGSPAYQWKRNGVAIIGATSNTYVARVADVGNALSYDISRKNSVGTTTVSSNSVVIKDTSLSGISLSSGTLSPSFATCTFSYTSSTATRTLTITPTATASDSTITVDGTGVISGSASSTITLNFGTNVIPIVVTNNSVTQTTNISISYAAAPDVSISSPTSITGTSATLVGSVVANGQTTNNLNFFLSTSADFLTDSRTVSASPTSATGYSSTSLTASVSSLSSETTYYVKLSATNGSGTSVTNTFTFVTPAAPQATTSSATLLSATSATLNGAVVANGDVSGTDTTVYFQYSTSPSLATYTEVSASTNGTIAKGTLTSTNVAKALTGLSTGQTYYFRVKASNNYGTNYGSILSFTLTDSPTVTTSAPTGSNLLSTSVVLTGTVNANADPTTSILFKWGTTNNPTTDLTPIPTSVSGNSTTNVQAELTGLTKNTTYYYKLVAVNSKGTASSSVISFTTAQDPVPTAVLSAPATTLTNVPFTIYIQFSENVTGFSSSDVVVSGATGWTKAGTPLEISGSYYSIQMTPSSPAPAASTITISMAANVVTDSGGQGNTIASNITVVTTATLAAPNISYPGSSYTLTYGTSITTISPSNTGGIIASWSGTVPAGLSLDSTTGDITGTPTAVATATSYSITATNTTGSSSYSISFTVNRRPITVTATAKSKNEGDSDPLLNYSITSGSLYSSDTLTGSLSRASGETASGGPYAITQNTLTSVNNPNYTITFVSANLTISVSSSLLAPNISISPTSVTLTTNVAMSDVTPTNSGGAASSWSITPTLPTGLAFSTSTGVISGTPTVTLSATPFTVRATNATDSATATISITVVTSVTVPGAPSIVSATTTGTSTATLVFSAPASSGGATIESYTAMSTPGSLTFVLVQAGSGTIMITGLDPDVEYSFTVRAFNSAGPSAWSAASASIRTSRTAAQQQAADYAAQKEAERLHAERVDACRWKADNELLGKKEITEYRLMECEMPMKKVESFYSALNEVLAIDSSTTFIFTQYKINPTITFIFDKYAFIDKVTSPAPVNVYARQMVSFQLIPASTPQKTLIFSKTMALPVDKRDTIGKIQTIFELQTIIAEARKRLVELTIGFTPTASR